MKLYRYEYDVENKYKGILVGLDDIFNTDEVLYLCSAFERYLPDPDVNNMKNTISYFTSKGNRKFSKAIREIKKAAISKGIIVKTIIIDIDNSDNIIYEDKYQVVMSSTTSS